jgi:hypothetical protein
MAWNYLFSLLIVILGLAIAFEASHTFKIAIAGLAVMMVVVEGAYKLVVRSRN